MTNNEREELAADLEQVIGDFLRSKKVRVNGAMANTVERLANTIADLAEFKPLEAIKRTCAK